MSALLLLAIIIIVISLFFAFTNGYNDSSASVATMIACRAATARTAVIFSSILNMVGAIIGGSAVAFTIISIVNVGSGQTALYIILSAVIGAMIWNMLCWVTGLPSSSTHALVGGLVGAGIMSAGTGSINWGVSELSQWQITGLVKVFLFLALSVGLGFILGYLIKKLSAVLLRNAKRSANGPIKRSQYVTAGVLSIAHGANDSQKEMGIIVVALLSAGMISSETIPLWVRLLCALAIGIGTLGGGWKIMKTLGRKIYPIKPIDSLDSQTISAGTVVISTALGAPVSSTQVVASSIMGIGAAENAKMVQWSIGKQMMVSWLLTIPATIVISAGLFEVFRLTLGI